MINLPFLLFFIKSIIQNSGFYGSSTGTCEDLAYQIAEKTNVPKSDVYSADKLSNDLIKEYDLLILGTFTWGWRRTSRQLLRYCEGDKVGNKVSADGYSYSFSIAVIDGSFVGLALDEVNENDKTAERIKVWITELKKEA